MNRKWAKLLHQWLICMVISTILNTSRNIWTKYQASLSVGASPIVLPSQWIISCGDPWRIKHVKRRKMIIIIVSSVFMFSVQTNNICGPSGREPWILLRSHPCCHWAMGRNNSDSGQMTENDWRTTSITHEWEQNPVHSENMSLSKEGRTMARWLVNNQWATATANDCG